MSAFIDASVIVAILSHEPDADELLSKIESTNGKLYFSAMSLFEATFGLVRKKGRAGRRADAATIEEARSIVRSFLDRIDAEEVSIDGTVGDRAIAAAGRFGKAVGHPARLNMADCFAYACAVDLKAALIFKGDDFGHTDVPRP